MYLTDFSLLSSHRGHPEAAPISLCVFPPQSLANKHFLIVCYLNKKPLLPKSDQDYIFNEKAWQEEKKNIPGQFIKMSIPA